MWSHLQRDGELLREALFKRCVFDHDTCPEQPCSSYRPTQPLAPSDRGKLEVAVLVQ